jgi:hypothetical protein
MRTNTGRQKTARSRAQTALGTNAPDARANVSYIRRDAVSWQAVAFAVVVRVAEVAGSGGRYTPVGRSDWFDTEGAMSAAEQQSKASPSLPDSRFTAPTADTRVTGKQGRSGHFPSLSHDPASVGDLEFRLFDRFTPEQASEQN